MKYTMQNKQDSIYNNLKINKHVLKKTNIVKIQYANGITKIRHIDGARIVKF